LLRVYGKKDDLDRIKNHAESAHLSASTFLRKIALAEIARHPNKESQEELITRVVEQVLEKHGLINKSEGIE